MSNINLKKLKYQPNQNPLISSQEIVLNKKRVRSGLKSKELIDGDTGELQATSVIHLVEEKDDEHFVKIFAAGVAASYELKRTASRVFQAILHEYEKAPMTGGYADTVYLAWFDNGLSGQDIGMSEKTFQRGLKELLELKFIAPRSPNQYWVNPTLFFKGDRAVFIKEYRRKSKKTEGDSHLQIDALNDQ